MAESVSKVACITGASQGIGAGLVRRLLCDGWNVALIARNKSKMEELCRGFSADQFQIIVADLSINSESTRAAKSVYQWCRVNHFGRLDLLVNNVGVTAIDGVLNAGSVSTFERLLRVNLLSHFIFIAELKPLLLYSSKVYQNSPSVINISSDLSKNTSKELMQYSVTKAAVDHLTRNVALELAPNQVRVNVVGMCHPTLMIDLVSLCHCALCVWISAPALVLTDFGKNCLGNTDEQLQGFYKSQQPRYPIGRYGQVDDVVESILFLADPVKSGWITGQVLCLDGGFGLGKEQAYPKLAVPSKL